MAEVTFTTSGSTGQPVRVVRAEAELMADAKNIVAQFPWVWSNKPLVVATVSAEHLYGELWLRRAARIAGCEVKPEPVISVEELLALSSERGRFVFVTTPSFLERAIAHPDFSRLHGAFAAIVTSGSALRLETAQAVANQVGISPLEIYGSTEAGTIAWRQQAKSSLAELVDGVNARVTADGRLEIDSPFAMTRPLTMSDLVDFVDARHFRLLGRMDRQVKILEKLVSLTKIERALAGHPLVETARVEPFGDGVERLGALLVATPAGLEALTHSTFGEVASRIRHDLRGALEPLEMPRRLRWVRSLPVNERGKTTVVAVQNQLSAWCQDPIVAEWKATTDSLTVRLVFPADLICFKGHFPERPILPGVAQLFFLRRFARQAFNDFPEVATYSKLKFRRIVGPGESVELTIHRLSAGRFAFALGDAASGEVRL